MATPDGQTQAMIEKLETSSGRPLDWWIAQVDASGLGKHGQKVAFLKEEHGLSHGYANTVVHLATRAAEPQDLDLVEAQYADRPALRPILEAVLAIAQALGDDVEVAPKKRTVSLRRSKQFALVDPATKSRVDLALNLRGREPEGRLETASGMCTHRVRLTDADQVDDEVRALLRDAYERA